MSAWVWVKHRATEDEDDSLEEEEEQAEEGEEDADLPSQEVMAQALIDDFDRWPDDVVREYARDCFRAEIEGETPESIRSRYRSNIL